MLAQLARLIARGVLAEDDPPVVSGVVTADLLAPAVVGGGDAVVVGGEGDRGASIAGTCVYVRQSTPSQAPRRRWWWHS